MNESAEPTLQIYAMHANLLPEPAVGIAVTFEHEGRREAESYLLVGERAIMHRMAFEAETLRNLKNETPAAAALAYAAEQAEIDLRLACQALSASRATSLELDIRKAPTSRLNSEWMRGHRRPQLREIASTTASKELAELIRSFESLPDIAVRRPSP